MYCIFIYNCDRFPKKWRKNDQITIKQYFNTSQSGEGFYIFTRTSKIIIVPNSSDQFLNAKLVWDT